jgi:diaminopimelate decarboxylase
MICTNIGVENGILTFADISTERLISEYGSPLYVMDEQRIRYNCRVYENAMKKYFGGDSCALYASKAASFKQMYKIIDEEGLGADVVSCGEIYTAMKAGFPLEKAYFHSNNKTDADIDFAISNGIGYFVVDNAEELDSIDRISREKGKVQPVILRLTPGIDPHTYEAVSTGKVDSKFGSSIETGQAEQITVHAMSLSNIVLKGFHCHVGSQVFDSQVFLDASVIMLKFIAYIKNKYGFITEILDLGGGYGVRYTENDPEIDIDANIKSVAASMKATADELGIDLPSVRLEPGRSIVADAGMTIYTVGTVKKITGYKNYVSVDGGMTDNPRFALYRSSYTVFIANKMNEKCDMECSVVGRCCESGDIIQEHVMVPSSVCRGDICAVATTGAYNYSMASNYNRICRLPIVIVNNGISYLAVRRESLDDIVANDI